MEKKTISQIKEELEAIFNNDIFGIGAVKLKAAIEEIKKDERTGIKKLVEHYEKELLNISAEKQRIENMRIYEEKYKEFDYICGIDEAGRGPFAGPVVAAAVILPKGSRIMYVNDSKKLNAKKREELFEEINKKALAIGVGSVSHKRIDEINILNATYEAMREAVSKLSIKPQLLLNDAVRIPNIDIRQIPIVKGDAKSISIAAASIIAKVTRDRIMNEYDKLFPGYDFASNKGYGSEKHIEALSQKGASPIHRNTFISKYVKNKQTVNDGGESVDK